MEDELMMEVNDELNETVEEDTAELNVDETVKTEIESEDENTFDFNSEKTAEFEETLEAIVFAAGHPVSYATLARVLEMTPAKVRSKAFDYAQKYNNSDIPRGVIFLAYPDSCQLCTKEKYLGQIREALGIKKSGSLSTSSMEALAIVAYNQPVTRLFVDTLRRADSSYAMNNLLDRGLIESQGRLDVPGRPMLYGTTVDFLRCFGFNDLSELPNASEDFINIFAKVSNASDEEEEKITDGEQLDMDSAIDALNKSENDVSENAEELEENAENEVMDEALENISFEEEATVD